MSCGLLLLFFVVVTAVYSKSLSEPDIEKIVKNDVDDPLGPFGDDVEEQFFGAGNSLVGLIEPPIPSRSVKGKVVSPAKTSATEIGGAERVNSNVIQTIVDLAESQKQSVEGVRKISDNDEKDTIKEEKFLAKNSILVVGGEDSAKKEEETQLGSHKVAATVHKNFKFVVMGTESDNKNQTAADQD